MRDLNRGENRSGYKMKYFPTKLTGKTWGVYNTYTNQCVATGVKHAMCDTAKLLNDEYEDEQKQRNGGAHDPENSGQDAVASTYADPERCAAYCR